MPFHELPDRLVFPGLNRHSVLLLNPVSVPFWDYVERTEWNYSQIRGEVVYVTALQPLLVLVVFVLEVHHPQEHRLEVELPNRGVVVLDQRVREQLRERQTLRLLLLVHEG